MGSPFHIAHRWEIDWQDDIEVLTLGHGVQVKVLYQDKESEHVDMLVKFPAGYVEPRHNHASSHSVIVLEGLQIAEKVSRFTRATTSGQTGHGPMARSNTRKAASCSPASRARPLSTDMRAARPATSSPRSWSRADRGSRATPASRWREFLSRRARRPRLHRLASARWGVEEAEPGFFALGSPSPPAARRTRSLRRRPARQRRAAGAGEWHGRVLRPPRPLGVDPEGLARRPAGDRFDCGTNIYGIFPL